LKNIFLFCVTLFLFGCATTGNNGWVSSNQRENTKASKIIVTKSDRQMMLLDKNGDVMKQYDVRIGLNDGPKQCEGDMKTPEGIYHIISKRDSKYVKFLELDYPQPKDIERAREIGCKPGNAIGIHAYYPGDPREGSQGCISVWTADEILEINNLVPYGTEVEITE